MSTHTSTVNALAGNHVPRRRQMHGGTRGASLGLTATQIVDLVRQIEAGLPYKALLSLAATSGLSVPQIASTLGIPERTLARRRVAGRLAPTESERLLRVSALFEKAVELFEGDVPGAVTWLTNPQRALGRQTPLAYARTEPGAREVEDLIGRLEDGVFS